MTPRVTVIVATYNSSATLRHALESVQRQDFTDFETWVIGDRCTDDSADVVAELRDDRFHWFNRNENSGSAAGPNMEGLARARGDDIAYLGHDDLWFPWHLSALVRVLAAGAALAHGLVALIDPQGPRELLGPAPSGVRYGDYFVPPSSWLHRVDVMRAIGGWRHAADLARAVDVDVLARVVDAGHVVAHARTLSVLKFPSVWWCAYARKGEPPQRVYLDRMIADAPALERDILRDVALAYSYRHSQLRVRTWLGVTDAARASARDAAGLMTRAAVNAYGADRWPLPKLLHWRYQRIRRRLRKPRGLDG